MVFHHACIQYQTQALVVSSDCYFHEQMQISKCWVFALPGSEIDCLILFYGFRPELEVSSWNRLILSSLRGKNSIWGKCCLCINHIVNLLAITRHPSRVYLQWVTGANVLFCTKSPNNLRLALKTETVHMSVFRFGSSFFHTQSLYQHMADWTELCQVYWFCQRF